MENDKKINDRKQDKTLEAHKSADKDIELDPEVNNTPEPEDDLDEGELARFENGD